jgi:hypothetical protein
MDNKLSIKTKKHAHVLNFAGPLQNLSEVQGRDKTQSRRLHEPTSIHSHLGHPFVKDGILTVYFESEDTRRKYLDMPVNHPVRILNYFVTADDDRGG